MIKGKWVCCPNCETQVFRLIGLFYRSIKDSPLCDRCLTTRDYFSREGILKDIEKLEYSKTMVMYNEERKDIQFKIDDLYELYDNFKIKPINNKGV